MDACNLHSFNMKYLQYLADPERIAELEKFSKNISEDKSRKRRASTGNDNTSTSQTTSSANALSEPTETLGTAGAMMVEAENTAFMRQLESLQVKKRARSFHQRRPGKVRYSSIEVRAVGAFQVCNFNAGSRPLIIHF